MLTVFIWWLWIQVIGLAALPLAFRFFRRLPDRGYAFARPLGLLLTSYVLWMGSSLGFLRNSVGGAVLSILVVAAASLLLYWRAQRAAGEHEPGLLPWLRDNARLVLAAEALFAIAFGVWALIRAYSPDLTTAGGEKFMEIMYLNSIGRSEYFPPHDAWLSGYAISYYHFGYIMIGMLTSLSGLPAHLTFNVGVALLFALTCTGAFGLVYNLVKAFANSRQPDGRASSPVAWGYLGALLTAVLGNLEGFLEVLYSLRALPQGFWKWLDIKDINQPFTPELGASLVPVRSGWWWWRASRVIHDLDPAGNSIGVQPIDEFPGFSFLLGDMHPHVLALPFVLLALAVALHTLMARDGGPVGKGGWLAPIKGISPLVALCLGALLFLNTWDFPIYFLIFGVSYGLRRWPLYRRWSRWYVYDVGVTSIGTAILGALFYLPFFVGFQSQAGGLLPTLYVGTRFRQYFVMFGPFLIAIAGFLAGLAIRARQKHPGFRLWRGWLGWTALYLLVPLAIMFLMAGGMLLVPQGREFLEGIRSIPFVYEIVGDAPWGMVLVQLLGVKARTWVMPLVVSGMAALGTLVLFRPAETGAAGASAGDHEVETSNAGLHPSIRFVLLMATAGLLVTLSVEFVYLVDHFRVRANTIFKFYFQAWVLMALSSAFAIYWLGRRRAWWRTVVTAGFWALVLMGMVYPILGNAARAGNFASAPNLDGTAYLAHAHPEDYEAIAWLNENVEGRPVILEAPGSGGSSYVYEGRVSALTGLPTLLGWGGHESQWRGNYEIQSAREPDIQAIYNSLDVSEATSLLEQYEITYVYVGPVERGRYDQRALEKFGQFMDTVYQAGDVTIYKMRQ
jgi:YYY domain-containing protein